MLTASMQTNQRRKTSLPGGSLFEQRRENTIRKETIPHINIRQVSEIRHRVGDYFITRKIGKGSGGKVFLGIDYNTNEQVAIKIITKDDPRRTKTARKEINALHALSYFQHPNIVRIIDACEDSDVIVIVQEYCQGGDLFDYIQSKGKLELEEAWTIFKQIVETVAFIHSMGIIHRDLKPENIFFDENGRVVIGDFGFSTSWSSHSKRKRSCGSVNFAPAEIITKSPYIGPEVDIFSLGGILYTMITGKLPFGPNSSNETRRKVVKGDWKKDEALTPDTIELLTLLFEPHPLRRATSYDMKSYFKKYKYQ